MCVIEVRIVFNVFVVPKKLSHAIQSVSKPIVVYDSCKILSYRYRLKWNICLTIENLDSHKNRVFLYALCDSIADSRYRLVCCVCSGSMPGAISYNPAAKHTVIDARLCKFLTLFSHFLLLSCSASTTTTTPSTSHPQLLLHISYTQFLTRDLRGRRRRLSSATASCSSCGASGLAPDP